jgi:hypothetical protein
MMPRNFLAKAMMARPVTGLLRELFPALGSLPPQKLKHSSPFDFCWLGDLYKEALIKLGVFP